MKYDPSLPTAVFLGPSLPLRRAGEILAANYYPPVRMGDLYRLLCSGVRRICLIDGVFHATTPVWQREILAALRAGIEVIGASSMGALRAAELAPYGMLGCGRVYRWYAEGVIEGDDEVALWHASAELGYQPLTQPLVDLRHNLQRAVAGGILDASQARALLDHQKILGFTQRGCDSLLNSPAARRLDESVRRALKELLDREWESIKALDAVAALELCAGAGNAPLADCCDRMPSHPAIERPEEVLMRGVPTPAGELLPLRTPLERAAADQGMTTALLRRASLRWFLLEWMESRGLELPPDEYAAWRGDWMRRHMDGDPAGWLADHGLTPEEWAREARRFAAESWLRKRGPAAFGLPPVAGDEALTFVADWARLNGVSPPEPAADAIALALWVLSRGPWHFGFERWSPDIAVLRELQMTSRLREFVVAEESLSP
jgi:hypothetical protein